MKIQCPHCRREYEVDEAYRGQFVECEGCGKGFESKQVVEERLKGILPGLSKTDSLEAQKHCPMCGEMILAVAKKCKHCGEYFEPIDIPISRIQSTIASSPGYSASPPKSRLAYILLGLFLGGFGVHNFYAGYTTTGIIQLLLTVLLFWTIIVPLMVAIIIIYEICTTDKDAAGVAFV